MLEIRPICENCGKKLPNDSSEAMICTFECTFCADCVSNILLNVCPNCGGGFERRPTRPTICVTENCVSNYPVATLEKLKPVDLEKFKPIQEAFIHINPTKR
ncbi:MAG: DUF1272 domain-containing protein [Microscillaceae bacterium]|nr:DUF1272 domain-containing protein [Microscillaceae bacterium]